MYIDFHAHILPGLDHGCKNIEEAKQQLELAKKARVTCIVATSHFYPHSESVASFLSRREEAYQAMKQLAQEAGIQVKLAAEVLLCEGMENMEDLDKLCVSNTNTMLLELPQNGEWSTGLQESLIHIQTDKNIRVLLAHVERYPKKKMLELMDQGFRVQMNGDYIASFKSKSLLKQAIKKQLLYGIGSDIHGVKKGYRAYHKAIKKLGKEVPALMERAESLLTGKVD